MCAKPLKEKKPTYGLITDPDKVFDNLYPYIVDAPLVLVLDRQDLDHGKVLGLLVAKDIVLPQDTNSQWALLKAGSFVRHHQIREGRTKLVRNGYVSLEQEPFGKLLSPFDVAEFRRTFKTACRAHLPLVKTQGFRNKAALHRASGVSNINANKPFEMQGNAEQYGLQVKKQISHLQSSMMNPKSTPPNFDVKEASDLLDKLLLLYKTPKFKDACQQLNTSWDATANQASKLEDIDKLCAELVASHVIPKFGFSATDNGMREVNRMLFSLCKKDADLSVKFTKVQKTVLNHFPRCFTSGATAELEEEHFEEHVAQCPHAHYSVTGEIDIYSSRSHDSVLIRSLQRGSQICTACLENMQGKAWIRCTHEARFWKNVYTIFPEHLLEGHEIGWMCITEQSPELTSVTNNGSDAMPGHEPVLHKDRSTDATCTQPDRTSGQGARNTDTPEAQRD